MKKNVYITIFLGSLLLLAGCEKNDHKPVSKDKSIPSQITNVHVNRLPGGVTFAYSIPKSSDNDILYVMAVVPVREGVTRLKQVSYYQHQISVKGFPDTSEYTARLYSVSRAEVKSDPVEVKFRPLTPPIFNVSKSIKLKATYGGISIAFDDNTNGDNLAIVALAANNNGELKMARKFYTNASSDTLYLRNFDTLRREFAVYVEDEYDNHSDTISEDFTPVFEMQLDKTKFNALNLDGDTWQHYKSGSDISGTWDGIIGPDANAYWGELVGAPQWFSFDLGIKTRLSRFLYYPYSGKYFDLSPSHFQIWGSNDPDPDWGKWTLLKDCIVNKPSGLPPGSWTGEDVEYINNGIEFLFPDDIPPVRYLRFKTLSIWNGQNIFIKELTFFGNPER